jgi:hypothetical protein
MWKPVGHGFDFGDAGGPTFGAALEGTALRVDTDGDGEFDVRIEGKDGFARLSTSQGFDYAVRLRNAGSGWQWAASGARVGTVGKTRVTLIDRNDNGRYDDFGQDAMIVGYSKNACLLSRVIPVDGTLLRLDIARDGTTLSAAPYEGPAGRLELAGHWTARAKLESAIVRSTDGALSFDLADAEGGLPVPAGTYVIHSGKLGLGQSVVRFLGKADRRFEVKAGATARIEGGGPLHAEFGYHRQGGQVLLDPSTVHWYGRAGEEYVDWKPFGKSPEFTVRDAGTRKEIAKAIFTGC